MTHYAAEAKRLGLHIPSAIRMAIDEGPSSQRWGLDIDDEGLCITNCTQCRNFRNDVRAALEREREANDLIMAFIDASFAEPEWEPVMSVVFTDFDTQRPERWEFDQNDVDNFLREVSTTDLVAELGRRYA